MQLGPKHPFYSVNDHYRDIFNEKIIKLAIDGGFTCPNRDGTLSKRGCIFCSEKGSGDFAGKRNTSIKTQYSEMKEKMANKWGRGKYIMYFQAFTNTYAPVERLKAVYEEAISLPDVVGISIATRPDCITEEIADYLDELSKRTYVCVELGLQTSNEDTALAMNRCYKNDAYIKAMEMLGKRNIDNVTHIILGLPHESLEDMLSSVRFALECGARGLKLQLLHIIKGTELYCMYEKEPFHIFTLEEYVNAVADIIERIPPHIVIHRITGDGKKNTLFAPWWSLDKRRVLNSVSKEFIKRGSFQGCRPF